MQILTSGAKRCEEPHPFDLLAAIAELAIVGDFDPAEVRKVVEQEFGTWKSPAPYQLVLRKRDVVTATDQNIETPDKANAVFMAGMNY